MKSCVFAEDITFSSIEALTYVFKINLHVEWQTDLSRNTLLLLFPLFLDWTSLYVHTDTERTCGRGSTNKHGGGWLHLLSFTAGTKPGGEQICSLVEVQSRHGRWAEKSRLSDRNDFNQFSPSDGGKWENWTDSLKSGFLRFTAFHVWFVRDKKELSSTRYLGGEISQQNSCENVSHLQKDIFFFFFFYFLTDVGSCPDIRVVQCSGHGGFFRISAFAFANQKKGQKSQGYVSDGEGKRKFTFLKLLCKTSNLWEQKATLCFAAASLLLRAAHTRSLSAFICSFSQIVFSPLTGFYANTNHI